MQLFMCQRDQKAVSRCLLAILHEVQDMHTDMSS